MHAYQLRFFRSIPLFAQLKDDVLAEVASGFISKVYSRHQFLFWEGDEASSFYIMAAGRVRIFKTSDQGREFTFFIATVRQAFDFPPLFDNQPHPLTASALSDARVYQAPRPFIQEMMQHHPPLHHALAQALSQATRRITNIAADLALTDVTTRLARLLIYSSKSEGRPTDEGIFLTLDLSQSEIAHLLGTAREVISRSFRALERQGLVERRRQGILIRNPDHLAKIAHL